MAMLPNFERIINAPVNGYLYLNIRPQTGKAVKGVLITVSNEDIIRLKEREVGYTCTTVGKDAATQENIFAFIAPDTKYPDLMIPRSYLNTCIEPLPENERGIWMAETVIENPIYEDSNSPVYQNATEVNPGTENN